MGFRFFRRVNIAPGVRLNFSKSGVSPSFGVRGARVTLGRKGVRKTVGIPGTGLFYTEVGSGESSSTGSRGAPAAPEPKNRLDLGFFARLLTPRSEQAFVDGCREYVAGHTGKALARLCEADHIADAAFLAGFLLLKTERYDEAELWLKQAAGSGTLGTHFGKYGLDVHLALPITELVTAHIRPCRRGVLLGLAELYQVRGDVREALACLKKLRKESPEDAVVRLSIAELVQETAPADKRLARQIVDLAGDVKNESSVHAALMLHKARALRTLGLPTAARDVLTAAFRKKKDRDEELLRAVRYERACVYEELGQKARARKEFEKLYAEDPSFEDIAERLGL